MFLSHPGRRTVFNGGFPHEKRRFMGTLCLAGWLATHAAAFAQGGLMSGLTAYYSFDTSSLPTVQDDSGNGNNGTSSGGASLVTSPNTKVGTKAFRVDGVNGMYTIPNGTGQVLPTGQGAFSIAFWLRPDTVPTEPSPLFDLMSNEIFTNAGFRLGMKYSSYLAYPQLLGNQITVTNHPAVLGFGFYITSPAAGTIDTVVIRDNVVRYPECDKIWSRSGGGFWLERVNHAYVERNIIDLGAGNLVTVGHSPSRAIVVDPSVVSAVHALSGNRDGIGSLVFVREPDGSLSTKQQDP